MCIYGSGRIRRSARRTERKRNGKKLTLAIIGRLEILRNRRVDLCRRRNMNLNCILIDRITTHTRSGPPPRRWRKNGRKYNFVRALIAVDHFRLAILCALSCILLLRRIAHAVVARASADTVGLRGVCPGHRSLGRNLHSGRNAAVGQRGRSDFPPGQRA